MARGGNATRAMQANPTSDQGSEELPGGQVADAVLHEVPLAFQYRKEIELTRGVSEA